MNSILSFENVSYQYEKNTEKVELLSNLSFSVNSGDFITFMGPKECGKSTIFSLICSFISPTSGTITFNECHIGYMFQRDRLFEWRTIYRNSNCFQKENLSLNPAFQNNYNELSKSYGIQPAFDKDNIIDLNNNLRQRISLITTLASDPDILLLDEPFATLDTRSRQKVITDVGNIIRQEGKTTLMITHDITEAVLLSDQVIILSKNPCTATKIIPIRLSIEERLATDVRTNVSFQEYYSTIFHELSSKN